MSDDLNKKIKQITDVLGQESMPDNLKGLLSLLTNSVSNEESTSETDESKPAKEDSSNSDNRNDTNSINDNIEMVRKVQKVMERMNSLNDPRLNLLHAIRPFLNTRRQKNLNNCINLIRMSSLTTLFDENDKGIF